MKKILYIISTLSKQGPVNVLYDIVKNIDRTKFEPIILTLSKEKSNSRIKDFEELKIEIKSLNLSKQLGYFEIFFKIKKVVNKINPDIVHSHCFRSMLFSALFLKKYKCISTIHNDYDIDYKMGQGLILGYIMSRLIDYALSNINEKIACSEYLSQIINNKKSFKVGFVNNGIDTDKFKPVQDKLERRKNLNLPLDKKIFIWVGSLTERKNPLCLAEAIKNIKLQNSFYIFCGDGKLKYELEKYLSVEPNVLLTGNVDNVQEYLQAADYYISTSFSEGLPLSVLEGMACGLPCILSDIEQHKYLFKKDIGLLYKLNNSQDLISKINNIINYDYNQYSLNAKKAVEEYFSAKIMTKEYQYIYEDLHVKNI